LEIPLRFISLAVADRGANKPRVAGATSKVLKRFIKNSSQILIFEKEICLRAGLFF